MRLKIGLLWAVWNLVKIRLKKKFRQNWKILLFLGSGTLVLTFDEKKIFRKIFRFFRNFHHISQFRLKNFFFRKSKILLFLGSMTLVLTFYKKKNFKIFFFDFVSTFWVGSVPKPPWNTLSTPKSRSQLTQFTWPHQHSEKFER